MDRPARSAQALYSGHALPGHRGAGRSLALSSQGRRASGDRHPRGGGGLELPRPHRRGDGKTGHHAHRAGFLDHGGRHRASRVAEHQRNRHRQGLLPAGHRHRRRPGADFLGVQRDPAWHAAGHDRSRHRELQRQQRAGRPAYAFRERSKRAAAIRLWSQFPPPALVHHSGARDARALRRPPAPDRR